MMKKLYCYSHYDFNEMCKREGWTDDNLPPGSSFISIIGSPDCIKWYLSSKMAYDQNEPFREHWFKSEVSGKVCNLEFDDISEDYRDWKGIRFLGMSDAQAKKLAEFIESNKGDDFYIHCLAGQSRSQGVVRYILDTYPEFSYETLPGNPCITPNYHVVSKLKKAWREMEGNEDLYSAWFNEG